MRGRRRVLIAVTVLILVGIVITVVAREASSRRLVVAAASPPSTPSRPPLSRAEEAYITALWPIHGAVERSAVRLSVGQIFYVTKDVGQTDLKARVDEALATFQRAEGQLRALEPPSSLRDAHDDYGAAVRLFHKSAVEVSKVFADGREDHLRAAYPLAQEASNKIREIGGRFWPGEFPPN
jgi:hypothetical protein